MRTLLLELKSITKNFKQKAALKTVFVKIKPLMKLNENNNNNYMNLLFE